MSDYWKDRQAKAQAELTNKNMKVIEKQLKKYYGNVAVKVMNEFEATYNKLLATVEAGRAPTTADLYKLDKYWQLQGQTRALLRKLGEKQITTLTKQFEIQFFDIYNSIAIKGTEAFSTLDTATVQQMINSIWVADGKSFSQRIWGNTDRLIESLNEQLIHCVAAGKKTTELKNLLQERFNVSYSNADSIARTEIAHIQTEAAKKRYEDLGIQEVEIYVDEDERTCPICAKHEGERHFINEPIPIPFHPRCRCCILPVIE